MKNVTYGLAVLVSAMMLFAAGVSFAQQSHPKVPITYTGDTDETIARRAQWIEGAKKEGKLMWWGTLSPGLKQQIIAEFNKLYPFVYVDHWRARGEEVAPKLESLYASGQYSVDVILGGETYNYPRWRKDGIISRFTDIIPGIERIPRYNYGRNGDWFIAGNNAMTPQYNTRLLSAGEAPKSWEDILDPKWKGHMGMTRDMRIWTTLAVAEGGWGVEKTENYLRRLSKQNLIWTQGHSAGHALLLAGEFKIFVEELLYHVFQSRDKGAPVDWVKTEPVVITGSSFIFPSRPPHPNAARLFLEWQCSPQGMLAFENITGKGVAFPGSGTRLAKAVEGLPLVIRTEETVIKVNELDLSDRLAKALGLESGS